MSSRTLLRGGCVLTLGARTPNFGQADVLIDDGRIAEVGPGLRARDAEQLNAADTIVMPGFVDTHRHAWLSLFKNLGDGAAPASAGLGADDLYAATLIGLLGAAEAGITTVVDFADLPPLDGADEATLRAHADAAVRTVFVHALRPGDDPDDLTRVAKAAGPLTTVAAGIADLGRGDRADDGWSRARELGMPIHVHEGMGPSASGAIAGAASRGLVRDDVTFVHRFHLDEADLEAISSSGAAVSLAPSSEMAGGRGTPPIQALIDRDIRPGLGVDDERVAPGDMFAQMRATISLQHATVFDLKLAGKAGLPRLLSTRDVIRYATLDGARVAGLRGVTGSLEVGRQADLIVLRTDRPNIFPINDPIGAVVWGMDTSNVTHVYVAGRAVMRDGALVGDVDRARGLAAAARARLGGSGQVVAATQGGKA